jgi:hypothetical protein
VDDDGATNVLKANADFTVIHKNRLDDECNASPAISEGQLFIRGLHSLYCIGTNTAK